MNNILLPEPEYIERWVVSDIYGASNIAARYCGIDFFYTHPFGHWQHGWAPDFFQVDPKMVITTNFAEKKDETFWVARKSEEIYLKKCGYKKVLAIGLPVLYLPDKKIHRIPDSLLVMPVHSLDYTKHRWNFDDYANQISHLKNDFSKITVCIHPSCIKKGYWINEFRKNNIEIVEGININDKNALYRLQMLLSSYEYMTTNGFGSNLAYGAYFGSKVSVFGNYAEYEKEDFLADGFYIKYPEILEPTLHCISYKFISNTFSELFVHPLKAEQRMEWGREQIGHANKKTPEEMKKLFRWKLFERLKNYPTFKLNHFKHSVKKRFRQ